jgi:hypothetical protein
VINVCLLDDGSCIRCNEELLEIVNDHFVHACVQMRF